MFSTRSSLSPRKSPWTKHLVTRSMGGSPAKSGKPSPSHERSQSTPMTLALPREYPPTPHLDETVDTTPFSESFSTLLRFSPYKDETVAATPALAESGDVFQRAPAHKSIRHEASYVVEAVSNIRDVDSEWDDEDIVEVMVVRGGGKTKKNATCTPKRPLKDDREEFATTPAPAPPLPLPMSDSYSILRTLYHSQPAARTIYLAYAQKSAGLVVVRAYRHPVGEKAQAERDTLRAISEVDAEDESPYLDRLIYAWEDDKSAYLVTPYHHGGTLLQYIQNQGPVTRQLLRTWGAELACGLISLHDLGVIHGAVRPSVVQLRANGHLILGGFENAMHFMRAAPRPVDRETAGEWHHAPEALLGWETGPEADWWAYGIVLSWMALGQHPFSLSASEKLRSDTMKKRILAGTTSCVALNRLDPSLRGLIEECLERNPAKRLGFLAVCEHPIFADIEWGTVLHESGQDLDVILPPAVYPASDSPERPVVLTPSLHTKRSKASVQPSRIALPPSPKPNDIKHRHARTLSHATSLSTFSSAHRAVLGRATRTRLPAARPISIAVPASPTTQASLRGQSPQSPPLTPSLSLSPPTTSSTRSSIQTPATTPLPQAAEIKDIPSPTPSEAGLGSPALSSFIGSPILTSSPAIRLRPPNPAPDRTLPLPLADSPVGLDTSMLTVRASMVPKPVPAGLGLTMIDVEGRCEDVDEFGMWTAATSMDVLNGHDEGQYDHRQEKVDEGDDEECDVQGLADTTSLRLRVRDKLRRRRREAVAVTPTKKGGREGTLLTREDLADIEITVPELDWYPDHPGLPPPRLMVNGEPGHDGLDVNADPFRASAASMMPDAPADIPTPTIDEGAFTVRKNQSFRWSALSLEQAGQFTKTPPVPSPVRSVGGRILRNGEALLRRSQYSLRSRWSRAPSHAAMPNAPPETPAIAPSPSLVDQPSTTAGVILKPDPREGEPVGLGAGVRRIGRGIGFTQKSPTSSPASARYQTQPQPSVQIRQPSAVCMNFDDSMEIPRGCYSGFSMRRRRASARPIIEVETAPAREGTMPGSKIAMPLTKTAFGTL
ncbi:unnamed protein product [Peniophora sp. CBMAI 1063]|nr:unnamed protein product [Peniophora sp. CBMAI 1063]